MRDPSYSDLIDDATEVRYLIDCMIRNLDRLRPPGCDLARVTANLMKTHQTLAYIRGVATRNSNPAVEAKPMDGIESNFIQPESDR